MKKTHHFFLLTLSISVTILVASLFLYLKFSIGRITSATFSARTEAASIIFAQNEAKKIKNLNDNVENKWDQLNQAFIQPDKSLLFIETLESLGSTTGSKVILSSIDNVTPVEGDLAVNGYVRTRVTVQGSWSAVFKTLMLAENLSYKSLIDGVRLDALNNPVDKSQSMWSLSFNLSGVKSI